MALYLFQNGASPKTAQVPKVTTGTAIKTLLQVQPAAAGNGQMLKVKEWGISFDGSAAATPIQVDLCETDVAATVTAAVAADITKFDDPNAPASTVQLGTANTGYTSTAEGTIGAVREFDAQLVAPTNQYVKQFPLGLEPKINNGKYLRIRVTAPAAVLATCYVIWEE